MKILRMNPGQRLSLQRHEHRSEFWKVIEGDGIAYTGTEERAVQLGDEIEIEVGAVHRLTGGEHGCAVLEIAFGEFDEQDLQRLEDDFGRA